MNRSYQSLPNYLKRFVIEQDYESYTSQEHATWRYILRRSRKFFSQHAVPCYLEGLAKTGISIDRIPSIDEMDKRLSDLGWGAIGVCGFIPPAAFLDFQARKIMPIAMDMRTVQHTAYTPAPDIVHEAAGHIPILIDPQYRSFLEAYATVANRAIITKEDIVLYEAIRILSDIKENPDTTPQELIKAEAGLKAAFAAITHVSEVAKLGRLAWWTAEYGLVGSLSNPKIYGAGLLSSVGESEKCLTSKVTKLPLTIDCVNQSFDITEPQPQLYVSESFEHLPSVLNELISTMAFKVGGKPGLDKALNSLTVNSVDLDSGISMSGCLVDYKTSSQGDVEFLKFSGPVQLSSGGIELAGHGRIRHPQGFSSPIGRWKKLPDKDPQNFSNSDLKEAGLQRGRSVVIDFVSGFRLEGTLWHIFRHKGKLLYLTFSHCKVTRGDQVYFDPAWGAFDLAVGTKVVSVHGGPADRETFGDYETGNVSTAPGRTSPYADSELRSFDLFSQIRQQREGNVLPAEMIRTLETIANKYTSEHSAEWLLGIELLELATQRLKEQQGAPWVSSVRQTLDRFAATAKGVDSHSIPSELVEHGMALVGTPD